MEVHYCNSTVKSMLAGFAAMGVGKKILCRRSEGLATVFLLHRAAGAYTGIHGHDPDYLERALIDFKNRGFNLVSIEQIVDATHGRGILPNRAIAFTVDDGYRDQIEVIAPIFVKHQVPLTIFLTTGLINNELWPWDAKIHWLIQHAGHTSLEITFGHHCIKWLLGSEPERLNTRRELQVIGAFLPSEKIDGFLRTLEAAVGVDLPEASPTEFSPASWDQVRQLESAGVRFAPHTHTHRVLSRLQDAEVRSELKRSLEIVMAETRHGLPVLAYPIGMDQNFGLREMRLAEGIGFSAAFAVCQDYAQWGESRINTDLRYHLGRFGLPHSKTEMLWLATGLQTIREYRAKFVEVQSREGTYTNISMGQSPRPLNMGLKSLSRWLTGRHHLISGAFDSLKLIHAERIERLVFVCRGNVCRSPYAEALAKSLGLSSAISCGVSVNQNLPAEMMAVRAALLRGKDLTQHISRSIFDVPLESSDCLVVMDRSNLLATLDVAASIGCQVTLISLWLERPSLKIDDPYGKTLNVYMKCFDKIEEALGGLLFKIKKTL